MTMVSPPSIIPVILSGGLGSRLWPLSRRAAPKQLLPLVGAESMIVETARRCADRTRFLPPLVVAGEDHRFKIAEQFRAAAIPLTGMLLEPEGRNTAAAVILAALHIQARFGGEFLLLVMPSDHIIRKMAEFLSVVSRAEASARDGNLVTFGMRPSHPATGYGYIQFAADPAADSAGVYPIQQFVEKPDAARAAEFLARGDHLWNSGLFLFSADSLLAEAAEWEPALLAACTAALGATKVTGAFMQLPKAEFGAITSISLDYAVMERTRRGKVVPADFGWSDVGAFDALWATSDADADEEADAGAGDDRIRSGDDRRCCHGRFTKQLSAQRGRQAADRRRDRESRGHCDRRCGAGRADEPSAGGQDSGRSAAGLGPQRDRTARGGRAAVG